MRSPPSSLPRFASLAALMLVSSGCNSAYREAFARAKDAALRGDNLTAARSYRDACRASPDDAEACGRVPVFSVKATDQALQNSRPACAAGDLDQCLPPLLDARDLMPDHPEVNAQLAAAGQLHAERCAAQWKDDGQVATAVAGFACLQSRGHQLPVNAYHELLASRALSLSSRFASLATTARAQGTEGAASVLWNTAQCLAPAEATHAQVQQSRDSFLAQSAIPVVAELGGRIPAQVAHGLASPCLSLASGLPFGSRCAESGTLPGQPAPLQIRVDALIQRAVETVSEEINSLRYVSGTRQVRNPRHDEARERVGSTERALRATEKALAAKEAECKGAKPDAHDATCVGCPSKPPNPSPNPNPSGTACDDAKRLLTERDNRARERQAAGRDLDNTPETVVEDVYDTFTYPVLTHHWTTPFQFTLETNSASAQLPVRESGELRFADAEHVGFRPAGLAADPLDVPPAQAYSDAFLSRIAPHVFSAVQRETQMRGAARRATCASLPAEWSPSWVQCWAEASLWERGSEPPPDEFLRLVASSTGTMDQPRCR
ncbi:hypothetical protein [Melittangium boletus]|uniref:hypothetical protein n=1 Tax=Melittangium boletus TaxID=83453 RepID=UPI003DA34C76